jgi:hypothetical protein
MDEITEEWRKLHNEELNDLYYVARMGERGGGKQGFDGGKGGKETTGETQA